LISRKLEKELLVGSLDSHNMQGRDSNLLQRNAVGGRIYHQSGCHIGQAMCAARGAGHLSRHHLLEGAADSFTRPTLRAVKGAHNFLIQQQSNLLANVLRCQFQECAYRQVVHPRV
jgi:hypothetical protein